jgi:F0F1-type ATP synthase delta subunit
MPAQIDALATVYARSLFELAEKAGGADKITEVAGELARCASSSPRPSWIEMHGR